MSALVFSDLDGTLLDHHSYDATPALPALNRLRAAGHQVVLNTSKTARETSRWHQTLHLDGAYIVENGAAIHAADGSLQACRGVPREDVLARLVEIRQHHGFRFRGFSDASVAEIVAWTGLSPDNAERARERRWSEPLRWEDDASRLEAFRAALGEKRLQLLRGGRFWHVQGCHDKASGLRQLAACEHPAVTVALGDGENDVAMLGAADIGVLVRSPAHDFPTLSSRPARLLHTEHFGPAGWAEAMDIIFEQGWLNDE